MYKRTNDPGRTEFARWSNWGQQGNNVYEWKSSGKRLVLSTKPAPAAQKVVLDVTEMDGEDGFIVRPMYRRFAVINLRLELRVAACREQQERPDSHDVAIAAQVEQVVVC